jgi:hypothetical protein
MSLSTKLVTVILGAGILIGAAANNTIISGVIKPSNFALAQLVLPFQTHVLIQAPLKQQPLSTPSPSVPKKITVQDVVNKVDIGGEVFVASAADCPAGTILTGGGYFEKSSSTTDFKIVEDNPGVPPGSGVVSQWQVAGYSPSKTPEPQGTSLEIYAVCVS